MMASLLAWLDHSEEDQRQMRELIALFTQEESRDELGIGPVRDAFSDLLFPGVSVLQTRARYLMFVPWIFCEAERRGMSGSELRKWAQTRERWLIPALKRGGDQVGLVGRVAGPSVKNLPSTIYWTALQTYGVAKYKGSLDQALRGRRALLDEADELSERRPSLWHPTLPPPPKGFFDFGAVTFALTSAEATWLTERIAEGTGDSMLGQLLIRRLRPDRAAATPWDDTRCVAELPENIRRALSHARLFALAIRGAVLVYNLLLARRASELSFEGAAQWVDRYTGDLSAWWALCAAEPGWSDWDRKEFWSLARHANPNIFDPTRRWVDNWLDLVIHGNAAEAVNDKEMWTMVGDRERWVKRSKSRLTNDRLLAVWRGASGTAPLNYRWFSVQQQLNDLLDGLEASDAGS
jgi:hypothetical protein